MSAKSSMKSRWHQPDREGVEDPVRRRIVAGARRHFFTQGFRAVTMDDLAEELGMSKKTLYAHFPSKIALLETVSADKFRDVERELDAISQGYASDFLDALRRMLVCIQGHMEEVQPPFLRDVRRGAPEIFKQIETRRRGMIQRHFERLLADGRKAGVIRKDVSPTLLVEILLGAVEAIMNPQKLTELDVTPKVAFSSILAVVFEGIVTEKGRSQR
jgi:AcrR family transcriptional regulator